MVHWQTETALITN